MALGHELQSEREEGMRMREWARGSGVMRGVVQTHRGSGGKQEVAGALGRAPRLASAFWQRWEMTGSGTGLGRLGGLPTGPSR